MNSDMCDYNYLRDLARREERLKQPARNGSPLTLTALEIMHGYDDAREIVNRLCGQLAGTGPWNTLDNVRSYLARESRSAWEQFTADEQKEAVHG